MSTQITRKQFLKRKTQWLAHELHKSMLEPRDADILTMDMTLDSFPESTMYKSADTGEIRTGLSLKGIRKLVKKHPDITVDQVRMYFNMGPASTEGS